MRLETHAIGEHYMQKVSITEEGKEGKEEGKRYKEFNFLFFSQENTLLVQSKPAEGVMFDFS